MCVMKYKCLWIQQLRKLFKISSGVLGRRGGPFLGRPMPFYLVRFFPLDSLAVSVRFTATFALTQPDWAPSVQACFVSKMSCHWFYLLTRVAVIVAADAKWRQRHTVTLYWNANCKSFQRKIMFVNQWSEHGCHQSSRATQTIFCDVKYVYIEWIGEACTVGSACACCARQRWSNDWSGTWKRTFQAIFSIKSKRTYVSSHCRISHQSCGTQIDARTHERKPNQIWLWLRS